MGASIERIVRPFETPDNDPRPRSLSHIPTTAPPGVLVHIGKPGGKVFPYEFSFSSSFAETKFEYREIKRVEETVRVTNPTDPENQFVDIQRIKQLDVVDQADPSNRFRYNYKNPTK